MPNYAGPKGKKRYINKAKRQRPTAVVQSSNGALGFMATLTRSHLAKKRKKHKLQKIQSEAQSCSQSETEQFNKYFNIKIAAAKEGDAPRRAGSKIKAMSWHWMLCKSTCTLHAVAANFIILDLARLWFYCREIANNYEWVGWLVTSCVNQVSGPSSSWVLSD